MSENASVFKKMFRKKSRLNQDKTAISMPTDIKISELEALPDKML